MVLAEAPAFGVGVPSDTCIEDGTFYDSKHALEFFATAEDFADTMAAELADKVWSDGQLRLLEPSAGEGALIGATLDAVPDARITAVELDERRASGYGTGSREIRACGSCTATSWRSPRTDGTVPS